MSNIIGTAARHLFVAYESGKTKPLTGQRLASFSWKTCTDKNSLWFGIKKESKAVSLPHIADSEITGNIAILMPHFRNYLESVQDKIIRAKLEASHDSLDIGEDEINIQAIYEYLEDSDSSGGRLTKEAVGNWFVEQIQDHLMLALAAKMNIGDNPSEQESAHIEKICGDFKAKVSALAGGKTHYESKLCDALIKCLKLNEEDMLAQRFIKRLEGMKEQEQVSLYDAL